MADIHQAAQGPREIYLRIVSTDDPRLVIYLYSVINDGLRLQLEKNDQAIGAILPPEDLGLPVIRESMEGNCLTLPVNEFQRHVREIYGELENNNDFCIVSGGRRVGALICSQTLDELKASLQREFIRSRFRERGLTVVNNDPH